MTSNWHGARRELLPLSTQRTVFSPDGNWFTTFKFDHSGGRAYGPQTVDLRSSDTGNLVHQKMRSKNWIDSVRFSADSQLAYVHSGGTPLVYRAAGGQPLDKALPDGIKSFKLLSDGTRLSMKEAAKETEVRHHIKGVPGTVWFAGQPNSLIARQDASGSGYCVSTQGPDRNYGRLHLYDMATEATVSLSAWQNQIHVDFHPDADRAVEVRHGVARQWDLAAHTSRRIDFAGMVDRSAEILQLSPSGRMLVLASEAKGYRDNSGRLQTIRLPSDRGLSEIAMSTAMPWTHREHFTVSAPIEIASKARIIRFAPGDDALLAMVNRDRKAMLVDTLGGDVSAIPIDDVTQVYGMGWRDGKTLALLVGPEGSGYSRRRQVQPQPRTIQFWSVDDPTQPRLTSRRELPLSLAAFLSPDGRSLLLTTADEETVWTDAETGDQRASFGRLPSRVKKIELSPDAARIALLFADDRLGVYETSSARRLTPLMADVHGARFSRDGTELVTGLDNKSVQIRSAVTGDPLGPPIRVSNLEDTPRWWTLPWLSHDKQTLLSIAEFTARFATDSTNSAVKVDSTQSAPQMDLVESRSRWHEDMGWLLDGRPYSQYHSWGAQTPTVIKTQPTRFHLMRVKTFHPDVLGRRSVAHRLSGDNVSAIEDLDRALAAGATSPSLWMHRGMAKFVLGDIAAAQQDIAMALRRGVDRSMAELTDPRIAIAVAEGIGQLIKADTDLNEEQVKNLRVQRGEFCLRARMWHEAIDAFTQAGVLSLDPDAGEKEIVRLHEQLRPTVQHDNEDSYPSFQSGNRSETAARIVIAVSLTNPSDDLQASLLKMEARHAQESPESPQAVFAHALALHSAGRSEEAIEVAASPTDESNDWAICGKLLLALAHRKLGNPDAAKAAHAEANDDLEKHAPLDRWQTVAIRRILQRRLEKNQ